MAAPSPPPNLSTVPRAAKLLGLPERTLYNWVRSNRVQSWRVANALTLVDVDQVASLVELRNRNTTPQTATNNSLMAAAIDWDTLAALHWAVGREELGAAYAVCAFLAWLALGPSNPGGFLHPESFHGDGTEQP